MVFVKRSLSGPETLGRRLRELREEAHVTPEELGRQIRVAPKYIEAIEAGQYRDLPGKVYARSFVQVYARFVGLQEAIALERFEQEYSVTEAAKPPRRPMMVQRVKVDVPWWRRHIRLIISLGLILLAAAFFSWQVIRLYVPPTLTIIQPPSETTTTETLLTVIGQTEPGARASINGQNVEIQQNGQFSEEIELNVGLNTLKVAAKKPRSRERIVIRQVLVEQ